MPYAGTEKGMQGRHTTTLSIPYNKSITLQNSRLNFFLLL